ncbi:MAG: hypothetical protein ACQESP_07525 [Candidatus Muiribacteriota bacterium]
MPNPFPDIIRRSDEIQQPDSNPGIQLFGRRFFKDQTIPEFLLELLLVFVSEKRIGNNEIESCLFPDISLLRSWQNEKLEYAPKLRLNLKLFSLLGASKLETRHESHINHYRNFITNLKSRISASGLTEEDAMKSLENLFLGLQHVGGDRTWCAQFFTAVSSEILSGEVIWKDVKYKSNNSEKKLAWGDDGFWSFFDSRQRLFLARGGEVLYLQICNSLRVSKSDIDNWCRDINLSLSDEESDPELLRQSINYFLNQSLNDSPQGISDLVTFIDEKVEEYTHIQTYYKDHKKSDLNFTECGWCPEETWREGYLFTLDILRICKAEIDPVERISLLETACAFQVLRTLCAQSARYYSADRLNKDSGSPLGYAWAVSDYEGKNEVLKKISRRSLESNLLMIQNAVRHEDIQSNIEKQREEAEKKNKNFKDPYKKADDDYGYKLFLNIAKKMGFIVPRRGAGARFVLTEKFLRFFVLTIIRPGERMTFESFKEQLFIRFGIAIGTNFLTDSIEWSGFHKPDSLGSDTDQWVINMLNESGMLVVLSDSCSMIKNPFKSREV